MNRTEIIDMARNLFHFAQRRDRGQLYRDDWREAWDFVKRVAALEKEDKQQDEPQVAKGSQKVSKCKGCGANIKWIKTDAKKNMPLDAKPVKYYRRARTSPFSYFMDEGYMPHWATCTAAQKFKKKK